MKAKTFYSVNDAESLEHKINEWISKENPTIMFMTQSSSGRLDHHVTVTIIYK